MIIYFTKTGDVGFGITMHLCEKTVYPLEHPEHPAWSIIETDHLNSLIVSAKDAGIHICHCEES